MRIYTLTTPPRKCLLQEYVEPSDLISNVGSTALHAREFNTTMVHTFGVEVQ